MFTLIINIEANEGNVSDFLEGMKENAAYIIKNFKGCIEYDFYLDKESNVGEGESEYFELSLPKARHNIITVIEKWETPDDYDAYLRSDFAKSMTLEKKKFFDNSKWSLRGLKNAF